MSCFFRFDPHPLCCLLLCFLFLPLLPCSISSFSTSPSLPHSHNLSPFVLLFSILFSIVLFPKAKKLLGDASTYRLLMLRFKFPVVTVVLCQAFTHRRRPSIVDLLLGLSFVSVFQRHRQSSVISLLTIDPSTDFFQLHHYPLSDYHYWPPSAITVSYQCWPTVVSLPHRRRSSANFPNYQSVSLSSPPIARLSVSPKLVGKIIIGQNRRCC
eukprot:Gb_40014 [translate_table: standard]